MTRRLAADIPQGAAMSDLLEIQDRIDGLRFKTALARRASDGERHVSDPDSAAGMYAHLCEIEAELRSVSMAISKIRTAKPRRELKAVS